MRLRRRAYTLIELLTAMILLGAAWATVALALHALYRAESRMRTKVSSTNSIDRLASRLRSDAHASDAASIERDGESSALLLSRPGDRILRYGVVADGIERRALSGDALEHRDVFQLPDREVQWTIEDRNGAQIVTLELRLPDTRRKVDSRYEIKAAVAMMRELTTASEESQP